MLKQGVELSYGWQEMCKLMKNLLMYTAYRWSLVDNTTMRQEIVMSEGPLC